MRKTVYQLDANHIPNNLELVMAGLRIGLHRVDELAAHADIERSQVEWALTKLRTDGHAEYRRQGPDAGWYALDDEPLDAIFVADDSHSVWGLLGYPTGVIAPLVGRVHRLPG